MSSVEEDLLRRKEEISGAIKICQDEILKIDQIEKNSIVEEFYANLKAKQEEKLKILQEKSSEISSLLYCTVALLSEGGSLTFSPSTVEVSRFKNELPSISFRAFDEYGDEETSTVFQGSFCRVDLTFEYDHELKRYVLTEHEGSYTAPKFSHGIYLSLSDGTGRGGLKGENRKMFIEFLLEELSHNGTPTSRLSEAKRITKKWNKLHPDLKVNRTWVYFRLVFLVVPNDENDQ